MIILFLLVLSISQTQELAGGLWQPLEAFIWGGAVYLGALLLIALQNRLLKRLSFSKRYRLSQMIAILCFLLIFIVFQSQAILYSLPKIFHFPFISYWVAVFLFLFTLWFAKVFREKGNVRERLEEGRREVLFLLPFTLPFLFFETLNAVLGVFYYPWAENTFVDWWQSIVLALPMLSAFILIFIGMPALIQVFWSCKPLPEGPLKTALKELCSKAKFRYGSMNTWGVMKTSVTAAIMGVVPRWRYVMFTESLLRRLDEDEIKAVLAHEIGHSQHKHLIFYPLLIFSFVSISFIISTLIALPLFHTEEFLSHLFPKQPWNIYFSIFFFLFYSTLFALYFRLVFGFFSRLFERQADLHVYQLGLSSDDMVRALDRVACLAGNIHKLKNWHHFSIAQRIFFLRQTEKNPGLIQRHHQRVKKWKRFFYFVFALSLYLCVASSFTSLPGNTFFIGAQEKLNSFFNESLKKELVDRYIKNDFGFMKGELRKAFLYALDQPKALHHPGGLELHASKYCLDEGDLYGATVLITKAWLRLGLMVTDDRFFEKKLRELTKDLVEKVREAPLASSELLVALRRLNSFQNTQVLHL